MWLIISFLFEATVEKKEMAYLLTQTSVKQAAINLRHRADLELGLKSALLWRTDPATQSESLELQKLSADTQQAIQVLLTRLSNLADNPKPFSFKRTTTERIRNQLDNLTKLAAKAKNSQQITARQLKLSFDDRDKNHKTQIYTDLNATFHSVGLILESINFLPRKKVNTIDQYQDLLSVHWSLLDNTTTLDTELGKLLTGAAKPKDFNLYQIEASINEISRGWENLENAAKPFSEQSNIATAVNRAKQAYYFSHDLLISRIYTQLSSGYTQHITHEQWTKSIQSVRQHQTTLAQNAFTGLTEINTQLLNRASRNYIIDIFLLFICIAACFLSYFAGRKLKQQAYTDPLTGVSNRLTFESKINASDFHERQMVIYFDLDNFKTINDNHGHITGDEVLKAVAERLQQASGSGSEVARLGGDEFAVYKTLLTSNFNCDSYVNKLLETVNNEIVVNDIHIRLELSAGYAIAPDNSPAGLYLLKNADIALSRNKSKAKTAMMFCFDASMGKQHDERRAIENELKLALSRDEFELHYQPKVDPHTNTVRGVEALIRWKNVTLGNVFPDQFIPIAEDLGLLGDIGRWVLEKSCEDIAGLHRQGLNGLGIAVNISAQQFADARFSEKVSDALSSSGLDAGYLELEVTESLVMHDIEWVTGLLKDLREKGVSIAIDDFGTGFSCLQHLQILPLDTLKIDRAFVNKIAESQSEDSFDETQDTSMVSSIIHLGELFGLKTVAEGIETSHQLKSLTNLGADLIQGYYYSRPVPLSELPAAIAEIESSNNAQTSERTPLLTADAPIAAEISDLDVNVDGEKTIDIRSDDTDDDQLDRAA